MPEVLRMVTHMHFLEPDNLVDMVAGTAVDMVVGIVSLIPWLVSEGKQQAGYASSSQKRQQS